jgi:hypothetical protein
LTRVDKRSARTIYFIFLCKNKKNKGGKTMRPMNLIDLLLQNSSKPTLGESKIDRLMWLNRQAAIIYNQASRQAGRDYSTRNYFLQEKMAIDRRVTAELAGAKLTNRPQYHALVKAVAAWQPITHELDGRSAQIIRQAVITALPIVRQKQELQIICQDYKAHLKAEIEAELLSNHPQEYKKYAGNRPMKGIPLPHSGKLPTPMIQSGKNMDRLVDNHPDGILKGSDSLNSAIQKYAAIQNMARTLTTPHPVENQIKHFKQAFQSQRAVIEKDRDSWGMKFVKAVTTVLSLGVAVWCASGA